MPASGAVEKDLVADSDGCGLLACTDTGYPRLAENIERLTPARLIFVGTGQGKLNITEAMVKAGITKVFR